MFFKNMMIYQLGTEFNYSDLELNQLLSAQTFLPCPRSENFSSGWIHPINREGEGLIHSLKGYVLFAHCKEEKILPQSVVRDELNHKINELQEKEDRTIYRKEKIALKEEVIIHLRYQAFTRKKIIYSYIDRKQNLLIVDTASRNKAEEICALLRKSLGSLKLALPQTKVKPEARMTTWLKEKQVLPFFKIENNCEFLDPKQKTSMIKCKEQDLSAEEIIKHLHTGKEVVKLALNWNDKLTFEFTENLTIKKIKFLNLLTEARKESEAHSQAEKLDADFALMSGEFTQFITDLWPLFDGLAPLAKD